MDTHHHENDTQNTDQNYLLFLTNTRQYILNLKNKIHTKNSIRLIFRDPTVF